jgi:hypothetical protein
VPEDGSTLEIEGYGLRIIVELIQDHRLEKMTVCKI